MLKWIHACKINKREKFVKKFIQAPWRAGLMFSISTDIGMSQQD